jgi:hypothetical protein
MIGPVVTAWLLLTARAAQAPAPPPIAQSTPDVQTIDREVLTRPVDSVAAADVDRLIEVVFKIGARIEGSLSGAAAADARRELDRLRDEVSALHGRVRTGARIDGAPYRAVQKDLLTLAQRVGSPFSANGNR